MKYSRDMIVGGAVFSLSGDVSVTIIGGVTALVAGGGLTGIWSTMWYSKIEPLNEVSSAALNMAIF